ncbi:uncharacterized protein DS421_1g04930 [Arachis hypogaea]|nr:uncharacterized protein DS421_1g04930 [Arachis hypogaea]
MAKSSFLLPCLILLFLFVTSKTGMAERVCLRDPDCEILSCPSRPKRPCRKTCDHTICVCNCHAKTLQKGMPS